MSTSKAPPPPAVSTLPCEIRQQILYFTFRKRIEFEARFPEGPYSTIHKWASDLRHAYPILADDVAYAESEAVNTVRRRFDSLDVVSHVFMILKHIRIPRR
ncbi:hypothetical protein E2P81_ATG00155 [Venturia nashicola]|uniref:Uncharacterized protein n=1 Tax=Venturia nashicola TaxID=86259 RepID=A0A4Z1PFN0_9PEZI|nr:hypothetical protein E6O75_ATG00163 [Venturia nashicola]TLD39168.1 hypothetical protein E2P81_ATG00155 [Venturia nashicola]